MNSRWQSEKAPARSAINCPLEQEANSPGYCVMGRNEPSVMNSHRPPKRGAIARAASGEQGQALIWLLGTLAASAAVLYAVFSVGQLHAAKAKTVNAADAAALAGATVEARILNLIDYNNRSMIANEVLLVQLISIESWLGYFRSTANNFGTVADIVGTFFWVVRPIGKLLDETAEAAGAARNRLKQSIDLAMGVLEYSKDAAGFTHGILVSLGAWPLKMPLRKS